MTNSTRTALDWAVLYSTTLAFAVFPLHSIASGRCTCPRGNSCPHPGKHPRTANGFKDATRDVGQVQKWWTWWPESNIGIATGAISGVFVIDVDPRNGGDDSLEALESENGPLPATVRAFTGGGGQHFFFKMPQGVSRFRKELAPGIDLKADGGYVVAAPSAHCSGRRYAWDTDAHPEDVAIALAPAWVVRAAPSAGSSGIAKSSSEWKSVVAPKDEGGRNQALTSLAGHLLRRYVDVHVAHGLLQAWNRTCCRPPLGPDEVTGVVVRIGLNEAARRASKGAAAC